MHVHLHVHYDVDHVEPWILALFMLALCGGLVSADKGAACRGQLGVQFTEHPMLLSEPTDVNKATREKMVERMFEAFSAPAVFLAKHAVLSSFALGRQTSLILDVGYDGTVGARLPLLAF